MSSRRVGHEQHGHGRSDRSLIAAFIFFEILTGSWACIAAADDSDTAVFARVQHDQSDRPSALQVAIRRYVPDDESRDFSIDLLGAVHVGDAGYYETLNRRFAEYDVVLYEMIAAPGQPVPRSPDERQGLLSGTQTAMKDALGLSYQLDEIDYTRANFVHADLSPEELSVSMTERGESLYVYFWRVFYASMDEYASDPLGLKDWRMISNLFEHDAQAAMRTTLAYELAKPDRMTELFGGESGSALIEDRNSRALQVLRQQLDSGATHIGIFYGVGHMRNFDERLIRDFQMKRDDVEWLDAWSLLPASSEISD